MIILWCISSNKGPCKFFFYFSFNYAPHRFPFSRVLRIEWYQNFHENRSKSWSKGFATNLVSILYVYGGNSKRTLLTNFLVDFFRNSGLFVGPWRMGIDARHNLKKFKKILHDHLFLHNNFILNFLL